jgi:DNA repair photolyase
MGLKTVLGDHGTAHKGRGAGLNLEGRFELVQREAVDDGWYSASPDDPSRPKTSITIERAKSILTRNDSPDVGFNLSINAYRGCEHGCSYCFARPSHAYLNLSPGLDFETRIFAKTNAAELLRTELAKPSYRCETIAMGTNTDPYQPAERELKITRSILEVARQCNQPVGIVTKSALVERDLDLLAPMAKQNLAAVYLSVTTLDHDLARRMEPRASAPARRIKAIRALSEAGVPVGVMTAPVIPFLTDSEMERILESARSRSDLCRVRAAAAALGGQGSFPRVAGALLSFESSARHEPRASDARGARQRSRLRIAPDGHRRIRRAARKALPERMQAAAPQ